MIAALLAMLCTCSGCFRFLAAAAEAPRHALVFAMLLSYALGFAGMLLAYLSYRKRHKSRKLQEGEPPAGKEPKP